MEKKSLTIYLRKIRSMLSGKKRISEHVTVNNIFIIPFVYSNSIRALNRWILKAQFRGIIEEIAKRKYILWIGSPTASAFLDLFSPELLVYNPVDRFYAFPFVDRMKIKAYEKQICRRADIIFTTAEAITRDLVEHNRNCITINHGVDFDHFNRAANVLDPPEDLSGIERPIIGYFGGLSERINLALIERAALKYPDGNFVLIGRSTVDMGVLRQMSNVHILGKRKFGQLPSYLHSFDVCLIPYHVNELMEGVDPVKLREYLCSGKPVVSVDLPEVRKWDGLVYIGKDEEDFVTKIGVALEESDLELVRRRIERVRKDDWSFVFEKISSYVEKELLKKKKEI